jgi:hypothetical protein
LQVKTEWDYRECIAISDEALEVEKKKVVIRLPLEVIPDFKRLFTCVKDLNLLQLSPQEIIKYYARRY